MDYALQTVDLTKRFGRRPALDRVSMSVRRGEIYGFIGENGAGKTTLIRVAAGLAAPSEGSCSLFGSSSPAELDKQRRRIGTMIENPALYPHMTAQENLEHYRLLFGVPDKSIVREMLRLVGLGDTGKKHARRFSLGMRQRLALAIALLGNPDMLLLDEPMNGLDPSGIVEVRELLLRLNREHGVTILISSHILGELSRIATCYGIIRQGQLVEECTAAELTERSRRCLQIRVDDTKKAAFILESKLGTTDFEVHPGETIRLYSFLDEPGEVNRLLCENNIRVDALGVKGLDLEAYFMELIGGGKHA